MKHHYWEPPIALYLFLGGLAGGIMFLSAIFDSFVIPGHTDIFALPVLIAFIAICIGLVFLLVDLGQPGVFWRVFRTAKSIIKWGAVFLVIDTIVSMLFIVAFLGDSLTFMAPLSNLIKPIASPMLLVGGFFGLCIMMYTGIMLSTLKAHVFWATPALPVLFTVSAISTGCAAIVLSIGGWPAVVSLESLEAAAEVNHILHTVDIVLVVAEIIILLTMVLSFLGAGNITAKKAAKRWVCGSYAPLFWGGMVFAGLLIPLALYVAGSGVASAVVAPVLVLCGGCLLRFLVVNTDDRAPLPGEERYMGRIATHKNAFVKRWNYDGENEF
ncbi:MAG: polysulfide reductase NrfD [Eggerthellaceae bacterium]|nr:polysulfide reductase NrfD [Eggerthellaceae bacterium]